jgi:2-methylcitrate dehydratase PrpD
VSGLSHVAGFIAAARTHELPAAARSLAAVALVDFVACAVAGAREPVSQLIVRQCAEPQAGEAATIIGHAVRARPLDAAWANGTAAHALDFDDSNMLLGGHPSVVLFPALLALGEARRRSGRDVLDAYVVGFEVLLAFARAVNFEHYEKGWHPTATLGVFGAAAAAAKLLELTEGQCAAALGLAASMSSGVKANFGTMAKPLQVGEASRRGVLCALLAADGCTASPGALEAKQGFFMVYNGDGQYRGEALLRAGDGFEILRTGLKFKKYACCGSTHAPIDAALAVRARHGFEAADVARVRVAINARRRPHVDRPQVDDELAAKFSVQFTVAAALVDGEVGLGHFTAAAIRRADLRDLAKRVDVATLEGGDAALAQGCELTVHTKSGDCFAMRLEDAEGRGSAAYLGYMRRKFGDCVRHRFAASEADDLLAALLAFDACANVDAVMSLLGAKREAPPRMTLQ